LDLFGQTHTLGMKHFGKVVRLDWQARDSGWLFDDLVITSALGAKPRTAAISVKSGQQVNVRGFPGDFVKTLFTRHFCWLRLKCPLRWVSSAWSSPIVVTLTLSSPRKRQRPVQGARRSARNPKLRHRNGEACRDRSHC
jgi:hypothetical protein